MADRVVFPHPNFHGGWECPICGSSADAPVVLVEISDTEDEGIVECSQVHAECLLLTEKMHKLAALQKSTG